MKKSVRFLSVVMAICMLMSMVMPTVLAVGISYEENSAAVSAQSDAGQLEAAEDNKQLSENKAYNEGVVLVKYEGELDETILAQAGLMSATALYNGSDWHIAELCSDANTAEEVARLRGLELFDEVDFDYIMGTTDKPEDNPNYKYQVNLGLSNIPHGWTVNGKAPGGSPDVVVAVIDTGVDYNHLDLRNNVWINSAEIPDNGKDDDKNGYVDDVYGWDCVGNDKDPMDDNGHGTHVAGIIAAENNKIGGIGVAYNCKIMVLKAGNSSGHFNNSDIAEAIQYAYMNGASVINMSFGGSQISIAVEEALENAYNTCVLVAAAGNDGACNNLGCPACQVRKVSYPAALPYVIGVMSTDKNGGRISPFSNYDHYPYDSVEYEVFAVGEGVGSTWPSNKYACLNGTSMAAPTVAGIAALLRSTYTDREVYSTKFIQSQIVNTGDLCLDGDHTVADVQDALTKLPKPSVNLYDYRIDDSATISNKNNGNGVVDAGETVRLYISLHNRGGVASNVNVSIDTYRGEIGDEALTDPYFTFVNSTIQLSDIGTYSVRESGDKYFEIVVDANCPNGYIVNFNIRFTYENGLDENDATVYEHDGVAQFNVSRGFHLPATIMEDTVYKADRLYIVGEDVVITEGVTVTFEEGCEIQFYDDREYYNSPVITVHGTLNFEGTAENMIKIAPESHHMDFACYINNCGVVEILYADIVNLSVYHFSNGHFYESNTSISNSYLQIENASSGLRMYENGKESGALTGPYTVRTDVDTIERCFILCSPNMSWYFYDVSDSVVVIPSNGRVTVEKNLINSIIYSTSPDGNRGSTAAGISFGDSAYLNNKVNVSNNFFKQVGCDMESLVNLMFESYQIVVYKDNTFSKLYQNFASQIIEGYYDSAGNPTVDVYGSLADASLLWPYVVGVEMFNKDGEPITRVGKEEIKVRITFNRPMDRNADTFLTFGTIEPYADYRIDGEYISDTVWEGTYTLKAQIENGQNFLKVNNAWAAEDQTKTVFGEYQLHEFTIDTTEAMAMTLQAFPKENGIELLFAQDDYDTLLGYNIYRSESKDGNYVKLNPAILLPSDSTFLDENAEPGKTYWYTYTVVLTDFTESNPAGKVQATAMDTLAPNMYHTPVNQGYMNNNLVISCTASDNVAIDTVTLYYRTVGTSVWKTLKMSKQSDKYSAVIFGSELTLDGIEYYIVASDGQNTINKGSAEAPYTVLIKDASAISRIGDVDGDGTVTTKDALMLMKCINGDLILSDDEFKRADLNGNGTLNSSEALRILQYINGNVQTLAM